jgi:hypothetical protein
VACRRGGRPGREFFFGIESVLLNAILGTGAGLRAYLIPGAADYAPHTRAVMLCLILLVLFLSRRCWCGYGYGCGHRPYYYGAYPYPYQYGAYTPYDPYWRARYPGYWYGHRGCYW